MRGPTAPVREQPSSAAREARTARLVARTRRTVIVTLAVAAFLTATGAFGVHAPLPLLFGYWVVGLAVCGLIAAPIVILFERRGWLEARLWIAAPALTVAVSVPVTLFIWAYNALAFRRRLELGDVASDALPCLVVAACVVTLNLLIARRPKETHAPAAVVGAPSAPPRARFLERLPMKLRGADLHAVQAEDHYLRLHTSRGSDLILFRLADAVAELDGLEGAQTHRSWWVAREAVTGARRGDGRAVLLLSGGVEAPVSRTYVRALRDGGWF